MNPVLESVLRKALATSGKALLATLCAALAAACGVEPPSDQVAALFWAVLVGLCHIGISALVRFTQHWVSDETIIRRVK